MNDLVSISATPIAWNREQIELLKSTIAKGATDGEFDLFLHICKHTGLDPFRRQICMTKRWNSKEEKFEFTPITQIDGYRSRADQTGKYAGNDDPVFENDPKTKFPISATVTVYKIVAGVRCPFTATARWSEYFPGEKQGFMWQKMPHLMLGKCAEALALRKAFPNELSGIYTDAEMHQAGFETIQAEVTTPKIETEGGGDSTPEGSTVPFPTPFPPPPDSPVITVISATDAGKIIKGFAKFSVEQSTLEEAAGRMATEWTDSDRDRFRAAHKRMTKGEDPWPALQAAFGKE